jgi:mannose-6-phosphate isomerase-like protein (cupin superfamily)
MSYHVLPGDEHDWEERPYATGALPRRVAEITTAAGLGESRARIWRYPSHTHGRRRRELVREEVFVVLEGTLTMLLGEPPERHDLQPQSVVSVAPGTALQLHNETDGEVVVFVYGVPPVTGRVEHLEDVDLA